MMDINYGEDEGEDVGSYWKTSRQDWRTFERERAKTAYKFREKKLFSVPMGILKSKIRFWILPQLLLTTTLLLLHIIINTQYNLYITFPIKSSSRNGIKEENVGVTGVATISLSKEDFKMSCPTSRIRPVIIRSAPQ